MHGVMLADAVLHGMNGRCNARAAVTSQGKLRPWEL